MIHQMQKIRTHYVQLVCNPQSQPGQKLSPWQTHAKVVREQMDTMMKQQKEMQQLHRDLMKLDDATLRAKISEDNPLVRMLAIQVAGKKRLPVEKDLIGLLADPYPLVRQAARQSLVRLARSTDFGPEPTATGPQIAMSVRNWNAWLALQQDAPDDRPSESSQK